MNFVYFSPFRFLLLFLLVLDLFICKSISKNQPINKISQGGEKKREKTRKSKKKRTNFNNKSYTLFSF